MAKMFTHKEVEKDDVLKLGGFVHGNVMLYRVVKTECNTTVGPKNEKTYMLKYTDRDEGAEKWAKKAFIALSFLDEMFKLGRISVKRGNEWLVKRVS